MKSMRLCVLALCVPISVLAAEPDDVRCRGEHPVTLMTERECGLYVQRLQQLQDQGDAQALQALQRQHAELLRERARACPCARPLATPPLPAKVALVQPDC